MGPGLVNDGCIHSDQQWTFKDCSNGETTWLCKCGESILEYLECNGG